MDEKVNPELSRLFKNQALLTHALTHRSWVNEHKDAIGSNERLEFLGDAILEFIVSKYLYNKFPDKEEGFLTALRANLVNTTNLAQVARKLNLGSVLLLSKGEEQGGGRENDSLLADTTEAVIGALFLDQGLEKTENFIIKILMSDLSERLAKPLKDPKSRLQELVQSKGFSIPVYQLVSETGPDHDKKFVMEVKVNRETLAKGKGKSKNQAEQDAAEKALVSFEAKD